MNVQDAFAETPLVAIVRGVRPDEVLGIAEALHGAGVRIVEVPLNSPDPLESIRRLGVMGDRLAFGAGTVLTVEDVDGVADAGGQLVVSPNTNVAVIRRTVERGLVPMPGFGTASEAFAAHSAGARTLKLFPAATYGPGHAKALLDVLPRDVVIAPVGGVKPDNMAEWWSAGARGFGLGGELYKPGMTPGEVGTRAAAAVAAVRKLMAG